jgi:hypothetical protein
MRGAFRITGAVAGFGVAVYWFAHGEPVPGVVFGLMGAGLAVLAFSRFDLARRLAQRPWTPEGLENATGLRIYNALFASALLVAFVVLVVLAVQAGEARRAGLVLLTVAVGFLAALLVTLVILSERWLWKRRRRRHHEAAIDPESPAQHEALPGGGITFYREDVLANAMVSYKIEVSGQQVGVLRPASSLAVPLPPGVYTCRARLWWGGSTPVDIEVTFDHEIRVLVAPPDDPIERPFRQLWDRESWLSLIPEHAQPSSAEPT